MANMQDVVDRARVPLNDAEKARYGDEELNSFANAGIHRTYELRPDLKLGEFATEFADLDLSEAFPLPARYFQTLADYVTGRAETKDDDHVIEARAQAFMVAFEKELLG